MAGPRELRRTESLRITLRPQEKKDLQRIAEAWGIPVASVGWAMLHSELQRCRKLAPNLGDTGFAIAAASLVLGRRAESADSDAA